jgi:hypothetical protein
VSVKGVGYAPIDTNAMKGDLEGKNGQQIRDYFNGKSDIRSATIKLSPFWVRHAPSKPSKIYIDILHEEAVQ